jgi:phospholipid-translocating ATPase
VKQNRFCCTPSRPTCLQNVASFTCQLYYAFFNSFSTETLFDSVNLTLYNITFTSLPIFVFALLEQERRERFSWLA